MFETSQVPSPFIGRELRPEVNPDEPAPPLLPAAPPPAQLEKQVQHILGPRLREALGVPSPPKLLWHQRFIANPNIVSARLNGETVLLNLKTAHSYTLNRSGSMLWNLLSAEQTLKAATQEISRSFQVDLELVKADSLALIHDLCREKVILPKRGNSNGNQKRRNVKRISKGPALPGLFGLHVIGFRKGSCGFLVATPEQWRATPAYSALLDAGYQSLSGGTLVLREAVSGFELNGLPSSSEKCAVVPEAQTCPLRYLLFPQAVDWPEVALELLHPSRALEELLPLTLLLRGHDLRPQEFYMLARLVQASASFRLYCGEEAARLPCLLDRLMDEARETHHPVRVRKATFCGQDHG